MMNLTAEFKARTFAGLTNCIAEKTIFRNPRDVEEVEKTIKWVKSVFAHGNDAMVTFGFFDNGEHNFSRIFKDWKNGVQGVRLIKWDMFANVVVDEFHEKLTTKMIRELYLETADNYINHEMEKGA